MARIPDDEIRQLKAKIDLAALVRSYGVELKRVGQKDLQGHCPFHSDTKTPNLIVTPGAGLWHCMACDAGGSAIDFVMRKENLSFREAVVKLQGTSSYKRRTGPVETTRPAADVTSEYQPELQDAVAHFHQQLRQSDFAMSYLKRRGLDNAEAIDTFKLGYGDKSLGSIMPEGNSEAARA